MKRTKRVDGRMEVRAVHKLIEALRRAKRIRRFYRHKPMMTVDEFCRVFYETYIFVAATDGHDVRLRFWDKVFDSVVKADQSFSGIDRTVFRREMTALQLELFGLAWMHHFRLEQYWGAEEKYTLAEIAFTKNYMEENGHIEIWNTMSAYNETIAAAMLHPRTEAVDRDFEPLISLASSLSLVVTHRKFEESIKAQMKEEWGKSVGSDCATRLVNRVSTRDDWGGCPILIMLTMTLVERLGWKTDFKSVGFAGLEAFLNRLYNDSKAAIEGVKLR